MLILATFMTVHFGEWRQSWHGMPRRTRVGGDGDHAIPESNEGVIAAIDYDSGDIIGSCILDTPAGFTVIQDRIYVNSMYGNHVTVLDGNFQVVDRFATRLMNDLHSVTECDSNLLLTSSGTDGILEVSSAGVPIWSWLAPEHGFDRSPNGHHVSVDRGKDHRLTEIKTISQATHCNSALRCTVQGRETVLATLFHQGQLIAIDYLTGEPRVLVRGMHHPHSIRRRAGGWVIADSRSCAVVLLSDDFWVESIIESDFNWIQDALPLSPDRILVADANNSRLVEWDIQATLPVRSIPVPPEWKIYQIEPVGGELAQTLRLASLDQPEGGE
jgi:hypothetical protein